MLIKDLIESRNGYREDYSRLNSARDEWTKRDAEMFIGLRNVLCEHEYGILMTKLLQAGLKSKD